MRDCHLHDHLPFPPDPVVVLLSAGLVFEDRSALKLVLHQLKVFNSSFASPHCVLAEVVS